ncbi:hypothetical protein KSP40_PGU020672 [Platanthera guangdongensis]|uniref:Uncharacterized protein n=1 Tax=Platanthera guangdongensis TaxID=2320717 RepID=A0ABR2MNT1_9ASPA
MASPALPVVLTAFLVSFFLLDSVLLCSADPTDGFRHTLLTESNFLLQKPYNLASADCYSYSNGFKSYVFVPSGTSCVSIMQIHRAEGEKTATDAMLWVYDGELRFYVGALLENNVYNR